MATPRPIVSAQKGAQKSTDYKNKPREWAAQERLRMNHGGGGHEASNWMHDFPSGTAGTRLQVEAGRGEEWFKEFWKKDRT